jgi:hypothetical protein
MARVARAEVFDPREVSVFHCIQRCVRRCFLCGRDPVSGHDYEHRKAWIEDRLRFLAGCFGIDVLGFAVMTREAELEVLSIVGLVDDFEATPPRQWLVTNDCAIPLARRYFGRAEFEKKRESLLRQVCEALHSAVSSDPRFSSVTWYDARTFDKPGDVPSERP